jgi:hypothetical protein
MVPGPSQRASIIPKVDELICVCASIESVCKPNNRDKIEFLILVF